MRPPTDSIPIVPDYELLREIGSGNYGRVYLGRNILGGLRAIKVVHRSNFLDDRPYDREYAGIMRYEPLSRGHPGLVSVLHVGRNAAERYFYYIMDLADDVDHVRNVHPESYQPRTLRSDLNRQVRLPVAEVVRLGLALGSALGHLHRHGVVHRDIKPSNIIFVENHPRFADIGLVEDIGESRTFVGSEGYTPPEGPGKPTADLYGLGKVLYEICTGLDQLKFPDLPDGFDQLADSSARRRLYEVTRKACELNPRRRFQTAAEMCQQLEKVLESTSGRASRPGTDRAGQPAEPRRLVVVGDTTSEQPAALTQLLEKELPNEQVRLFIDRPGGTSVEQARRIENEISQADVVVALLTPASLQSEMLAYELQLAQAEAQQQGGRPVIVPLLINLPDPAPPQLAELIGAAHGHRWPPPHDPAEGLRLVRSTLESQTRLMQEPVPLRLESVGGAVPLDSPFYLARPADAIVCDAILAGESLVLIKGARQMGKTSLLARGLQQARERGIRVVFTDFQQLNAASFESLEKLYFALGNSLADGLGLDTFPEDSWSSQRSPNRNLEGYLREHVLGKLNNQLVWGIDEVDRLLPCRFGSEVFSLFRSWHSRRALDPSTPWSRLTLAMAYATEAHLFIQDLNQSPFNVGTRVALEDFSREQVAELNRLYGSPLKSAAELQQLVELVGGQPYLVRRSLHEIATRALTVEAFQQEAEKEEGVFGDHLRRLVMLVAKDATLVEAVRRVTQGEPCPTPEAFHRLRSAGVIVGSSVREARPRCRLYERFLQKNL